MVEILFVLTAIGAAGGAVGGIFWNGYAGLLLGGSIGVVASVLCWALVYVLSSRNTPQRLDAHLCERHRGSMLRLL